ncbi:MAG: sulfite exporter TauE/SafE family protein [Gemmatimonas sp.]
MIESAVAILGASLLGSVHCAGMCGGFVCYYTGGVTPTASPMRAHALYNVGRLVSYVLLGAVAGGIGAGVTHVTAFAGVANGAAILAGVMMISWGLVRVLELRGVRIRLPRSGVQLASQHFLGALLRRVSTQPLGIRAALTGLVTTLLPCGWLYVFVSAAAGTGSVARGMLLMAVFWLGNVPALVAVGIGAQHAFGPLQKKLPMLSAVAVTLLGLFALFGHLNIASLQLHHVH